MVILITHPRSVVGGSCSASGANSAGIRLNRWGSMPSPPLCDVELGFHFVRGFGTADEAAKTQDLLP